jgi:hypothetical protein
MMRAALVLLLACGGGPEPSGSSPTPPQTESPGVQAPSAATPAAPAAPASGDPVVAAMQGQPLRTTRHGACRMACRHLDEAEVRQILAEGTRDPARTRDDGRCPSHALEGRTRDGQQARVVFAACPDETRVVTAIDLDTDWPCDCP